MIKNFSITELRKNLQHILTSADEDGSVRITHRNGKTYILCPEKLSKSPFDIPGLSDLHINLTSEEILESIRDYKERDYPIYRIRNQEND